MFKPLLETLPSLSGNMKISCFLNGYKDIGNNIYECHVDKAKLIPIHHSLYNSFIDLNLKNGLFEYDIASFFSKYSDIFYKTNFNYSQINIPIIDFTSTIYDCSKDFQFGCKRISYSKFNNTLAFYTPIYVENINDIKNKKFRIKCIFSKLTKITKYIDIRISNDNKSPFDENCLADYLERYCSKIDNNVIYCSNSYKNIYHGIDCNYGGIVKYEDNLSKNLYFKYYTINDFDCILNDGFKRNSLVMKQILNLCFVFDPNNILDNTEKNIYQNAQISISGEWIDNDSTILSFYDFSTNYSYFTELIYKLNTLNIGYKYVYSGKNIMNINYPGLNESSSNNYKYINTVAKNYNRWKLKYSSDLIPYIINLNYAFSENQNSEYNYKEFPSYYSPIFAFCTEYDNYVYNLIYDWNDIYYNGFIINNKDVYDKLCNQNYISAFFNVLVKEDKMSDESQKYLNIFDQHFDGFWGNIDKIDNKLYYKGILYDFNILYKKINKNLNIDKFGLFVIPNFNTLNIDNNGNETFILSSNYNEHYKEAKYLIDITDEQFVIDYDHLKQNINSIKNNVILKKNQNGNYIVNNTQYDTNIYYDINDLLIIDQIILRDLSTTYSNSDDLNNIIFRFYSKYIIEGYKLLDVSYIDNLKNVNFTNILKLYHNSAHSNDDNVIFRENKFLAFETIYNTLSKIYFSIYPSKRKYNILEHYDLFVTTNTKQINLYIFTNFISKSIIENDLLFNSESIVEFFKYLIENDIIDIISKYYYCNGLYNEKDGILYTDPIFKQIDLNNNQYGEYDLMISYNEYDNQNYKDENYIYVDTYNLKYIYSKILEKPMPTFMSRTFYCKFLNMKHVNWYFELIGNTYDPFDSPLSESQLLNNIFIRITSLDNMLIHSIKGKYNTIRIYDEYYPLSDYFGSINVSKINVFKYIDYNYNTHNFYFKNEYFTDIINTDLDIELNSDRPLIISFDLVFKKDMVRLNSDLYSLINSPNRDDKYKDLYLYRLCLSSDNKHEYNYSTHILGSIKKSNVQDIIDFIKKYINNNTNNCLEPYFNSIYEENKVSTKIYSDSFIGNIIKTDNNYYKYNVSHIDFVTNIVSENNLHDDKYILLTETLKEYNDKFVTNTDFLINNEIIGDTSYVDIVDNNFITYSYNGYNYGFYIINTYFDNTKHSLNLQSMRLNKINCVDYINNVDIRYMNTYSYSYLKNTFINILPYISNTNIVKTILNDIPIVVYPKQYKLDNHYKPFMDKNNAYTIYYSSKPENIELYRYFDNIVPLITETNIVTSYYLYYKDTNKYIENDIQSYIMYELSNGLDKYEGCKYFTYNNVIKTFIPTEYKWYNDNIYYNLEKSFICDITPNNTYMTYEEMKALENDKSFLFDTFKQYMKKNMLSNGIFNNTLTDNDYLFLYKKYSVKFSHIRKSDNEIFWHDNVKNYKNKYAVKIKFDLL